MGFCSPSQLVLLALRDRGSRKGRGPGAPLNSFRGGRPQPLIACQDSGGPGPRGGLPGVRRQVPDPGLSSHPPAPSRLGGADPGPGRAVPPPPTKQPLWPAASWDPMTSASVTSPAGPSAWTARALWRPTVEKLVYEPRPERRAFHRPLPTGSAGSREKVQGPCLALGVHQPLWIHGPVICAPSSSNTDTSIAS